MNMTEIKAKAKDLGIKIGKMGKADLIRTIQTKEGNFPCFETAKDFCSQKACSWREACLPSKKTMKDREKKKTTYTKKITTKHKELKKQLADLEKKATKMVGKGKTEALDDIKKIKTMMVSFTKKIKGISTTSEEAWTIAKKGLDDAWDDLSNAFKKAAKKF